MKEHEEGLITCPHCGYVEGMKEANEDCLAASSILQGRYIVGQVLGEDEFGTRYIGFDALLERRVIIYETFTQKEKTKFKSSEIVDEFEEGSATYTLIDYKEELGEDYISDLEVLEVEEVEAVQEDEVASEIAVDTAIEIFEGSELIDNDLLETCIHEAHFTLKKLQIETNSPNDLKTTMTVVYVNEKENTLQFAHLGDSRIYVFQKHKILTQSLDHSIPQMLVYQGEIKEKDIRFHEDRNRLTRVVGGIEDVVKPTVSEKIILNKDMKVLMCSDGFWEWFDEKFMIHALKKSKSPEQWLEKMEVQIIKKGKNRDNYTAIAIYND